jgi:hypothetical protein
VGRQGRVDGQWGPHEGTAGTESSGRRGQELALGPAAPAGPAAAPAEDVADAMGRGRPRGCRVHVLVPGGQGAPGGARPGGWGARGPRRGPVPRLLSEAALLRGGPAPGEGRGLLRLRVRRHLTEAPAGLQQDLGHKRDLRLDLVLTIGAASARTSSARRPRQARPGPLANLSSLPGCLELLRDRARADAPSASPAPGVRSRWPTSARRMPRRSRPRGPDSRAWRASYSVSLGAALGLRTADRESW